MKFAINENTILQCNVLDFAASCAKAGFDAVELRYSRVREALCFLSKNELRNRLRDFGLKLLSLNAFEDALLVPEENIKNTMAEAELIALTADSVDCHAIVIPSSRWLSEYGPALSEESIMRRHTSNLSAIVSVFEKYGVEPLFEPIAYPEFVIGTPGQTNDVLALGRLKDIRIVPDVHNLHFNGEGPEQIKRFNSKIGLFHIDDTIGAQRNELHVAKSRTFPGQGVAGVKGWVREARKVGFDGYFSLELFDEEIYAMEPHEAARLCYKNLTSFDKALC